MDGKLELQDDALSVEGSDHFCVQENKPLTEWKLESVDSANDLTSEVKTEEDSVGLLISCPAQNFKSEVEFSSAHTQKEELSLKEMTEENKVCAERTQDSSSFQRRTERDSALSALCEAAREASEQLNRSLKEQKKRFECESCGRRYTRKNDLRIHTLVHSGRAPYSCDVCGQGFTQLGSLRRHAALHRDERPFKCGQCGRSFRRSESLEIHSRHHTGEKPYKCDVCAKCFTQSRYLRIHECLHTGVRPFKCQVCGKRFVVQAKLRAHARQHAGEEPIKCRGCGEMEHHQRQHTGEGLSKCKCPRNAEELKVHVRENSLKCDVLWKMSLAFRESE